MITFKIAKPGVDVKTSRIAEEIANKSYASPKINTKADPPHVGVIRLNWASSGVSYPLDSTTILYSFPHNYGYTPTCFAIYDFDNGSKRADGTLPFQVGAIGMVILDADEKNINLKWQSTDLTSAFAIPPFLMHVKFYVMAERGYE